MHVSRTRLAAALLGACLLTAARVASLEAQALPDAFVRTGDRVRLQLTPAGSAEQPSRFTGVLERVRSDSLAVRLADGSVVSVPLGRVRQLHVSDGRRPLTKQGIAVGLLAGAVGGAIAGLTVEPNEYFPRPVVAAAGAAVFGLAGSVAGGVLGAVVRGERWSRVRTELPLRRVRLEPQLAGSADGLQLRVVF